MYQNDRSTVHFIVTSDNKSMDNYWQMAMHPKPITTESKQDVVPL